MNWPNNIQKIYVICHKENEKDRYDRLVQQFKEVNVPESVVQYWAPIWGDQLTNELIFNVTDPFMKRGMNPFSFKSRNLLKAEISLMINTFSALRDAVDKNYSNIIVFESDVFLRNDFVERLHQIFDDVKDKEWGYISLSEGVGTRPPNVEKSYFGPTKTYDPPHNCVYRCCDSMLFSNSYLKKIYPTLFPFHEPMDWEMNFQNMIHNGKALWADPPLVEPGTNFSRLLTTLPS